MTDEAPDHVLRFHCDDAAFVGARWWNESFSASYTISLGRRNLHHWLLGGAALYLLTRLTCSDEDGDDDVTITMAALDLQRQRGWNVGLSQARLSVPNATSTDVDGGQEWQTRMASLAQVLSPQSPQLQPHYVPTLFQVLAQPNAEALRTALRPMYRSTMGEAYEAGRSLSALIADAETPKELAVIFDLPGPESVAAAAALGETMEPVFTFDNWPHPSGVVPAHETLAATLYYLPRFLKSVAARRKDAPPVFVLDASRLSPYRDEPDRFDNRYVARLPMPATWKGMGVTRLLYVRPARSAVQELDDLNEEFVAYRAAGIDIKMVSLGDFRPDAAAADNRHYWGGSPHTHVMFWPSYGWFTPSAYAWAPNVKPSGAASARPAITGASLAYQPVPRATMFSGRTVGGLAGVGKQRPSGFGYVTVRSNPRTGAVTGYASGRSGSFGRSRSSWGG